MTRTILPSLVSSRSRRRLSLLWLLLTACGSSTAPAQAPGAPPKPPPPVASSAAPTPAEPSVPAVPTSDAPAVAKPRAPRPERARSPVALEQFAEVRSARECTGGGMVWTMAGTSQTIFGNRRVTVRDPAFSMRPFETRGLHLIADDLDFSRSERWELFLRLNGKRLLKPGKYRQSPFEAQDSRNPIGIDLDFPGEADKCGDEGSIELSELRWVGSEIATFSALISQKCVKDPLREVTGCVRYENALLLEAERDLKDPRARLAELQAASPAATASQRAHDPAACAGSGSRLAVQAKSKHTLLMLARERVLDHPKAQVSSRAGGGSHQLQVVLQQEIAPAQRGRQAKVERWDMQLNTPAPLARGLYSAIEGYAHNSATMTFVANASSCDPTAARVVVHELAPDHSAGLFTFEVQCGGNQVVLSGCARFAP